MWWPVSTYQRKQYKGNSVKRAEVGKQTFFESPQNRKFAKVLGAPIRKSQIRKFFLINSKIGVMVFYNYFLICTSFN
jgi:hypothetical protein